jgi:2-dehydropantoate 2-reductase
MRHAILGPGGMGGLIAASLARSGAVVTVVVRNEPISQYPDTLQLESPFGKFSARVERTTTVPAVDVLWIAVKATQLDSALVSLPNGNSARAIIPLLNGIDHVAMLRSRYGCSPHYSGHDHRRVRTNFPRDTLCIVRPSPG